MKSRIFYILGFVFLVGVEFVIGLFFHDDFVRPYLGDVIIIWVLYFFVRIIFPKKFNSYIIAFCIMIFAFIVEFLQKIHIVDILGIKNNFLRVLIGTSFAVNDLYCYVAGTLVIVAVVFVKNHISK